MMERKRKHDEGGAPSYRLDEAADQPKTAPPSTMTEGTPVREKEEKRDKLLLRR